MLKSVLEPLLLYFGTYIFFTFHFKSLKSFTAISVQGARKGIDCGNVRLKLFDNVIHSSNTISPLERDAFSQPGNFLSFVCKNKEIEILKENGHK